MTFLGRLALALASVLVTLAAGELVVRVAGLGEPPAPPPGAAPPDPSLEGLPELDSVFELARPNVRGVFAGVLHRTNSAGIRGPEVSPDPAPGAVRIVVIGDSVAMGFGVDEPDVYSAVVQRALNERAGRRRYEVVNVAVAGMNTLHAVQRLQRLGLRYQPRVVVYGFTLNDIEGSGYRPNLSDEVEAFRATLDRFDDSPSLLLREVWRRLVLLRSAWRPMRGTYEHALQHNYFHNPQAWSRVARGLDLLAAITRQNRACGLVLIHTRIHQLRLAHPMVRFYDHIEHEARARGLAVVQSYPAFRGRSADALRLGPLDDHPNPAGHRLLAEVLLEGLDALPASCGLGLAAGAAGASG